MKSKERFESDISKSRSVSLRLTLSSTVEGPQIESSAVGPHEAAQLVFPGTSLPNDFVGLANQDAHLLYCSNCARHFSKQHYQGYSGCWNFRASAHLRKSPWEWVSWQEPVERNPLKDISLHNKDATIEGLLLLQDLKISLKKEWSL